MTKRHHKSRKRKTSKLFSGANGKALSVLVGILIAIVAGLGFVDTKALPEWAQALVPQQLATTPAATARTVSAETPKSLEAMARLEWPQPQTRYATYESARKKFWAVLYADGGTELYCGVTFAGDKSNPINETLSVEHAYPADEIAEHYPQCTDRTCKNPAAERAMADLNNLWPAVLRVNSSRGKARFGEIAGGSTSMTICLDRNGGADPIVEPRDAVKGDVARSVLYMHFVYGLPIENAATDAGTLLAWMQSDPVDADEVARNARIVEMQGAGNPLVGASVPGM